MSFSCLSYCGLLSVMLSDYYCPFSDALTVYIITNSWDFYNRKNQKENVLHSQCWKTLLCQWSIAKSSMKRSSHLWKVGGSQPYSGMSEFICGKDNVLVSMILYFYFLFWCLTMTSDLTLVLVRPHSFLEPLDKNLTFFFPPFLDPLWVTYSSNS